MIFGSVDRLSKVLVAAPLSAALVAVCAGACVLAGWILDIPALKSVDPVFVSMKANTAIAFILLGASLWLVRFPVRSSTRTSAGRFFSSLVVLIGVLTLAEYIFNWNAGLDQLLFKEPPGTIGTFAPGRMALNSSLSFLLLGLSLLSIDSTTARGVAWAQLFALASGLISLLGVLGYVYGAEGVSGLAVYTRMAPLTAATFVFLSIGTLSARPGVGFMTVVTGQTTGGFMARRLLPSAVAVPIALGWITTQGEHLGLYGNQYGDVIAATGYIAIAIVLVWRTARSINLADAERTRAERALAQSELELRRVWESSFDGMRLLDEFGTILMVNDAYCKLVKKNKDELVGRPLSVVTLPSNQDHSVERFRQRFTSGSFQSRADNQLELWDGRNVWFEVSNSYLELEGQPKHLLSVFRDVTERKVADEALRKSEERFSQVAESAGEWIWETDADGVYTYASPAVEKILGYAPAEIVAKKHFYDLFDEETRDELRKSALTAFSQKAVIRNLVNANRHRDGSLIYLQTNGVPIIGDGGVLLGYRGTDTDITKQKHAAAALAESEREFRELFDHAPVWYHELGPDGRITRVNQTELRALGYEAKEMVGQYVWKFLDDQETSREATLAKLSGSRPLASGTERLYRRKDGTTVNVLLEDRLLNDTDGRITGIRTTLQDNTDLKRAQDLLRTSEERYRTLVQNMAEGLGIVDEEERFRFANPAAEAIFGVLPGSLVGCTLSKFLDPAEFKRVQVETGYRRGGKTNSYELEIIRPDYGRRHVLVTVSPLVDKDGEFDGSIGIFRDLTDRKNAELEREKLVEELKTALENVRTLNGLVPICSSCKKIRDDKGYWNQLEKYIIEHTDAKLTHGLCPDCARIYFPERRG